MIPNCNPGSVHFFDHAIKEVLEWCNANGTVPTSCGQFDSCASDLIEEGFWNLFLPYNLKT